MKRSLVIALLVLALLIGASGLSLHLWLHQSPPLSVTAAENALASQDLALIGHLDHSKLVTILDALGGADDPAAAEIPGTDSPLFEDLYHGAANLRSNVEHAVIGVHASESGSPTPLVVLIGAFNAADVRAALASGHTVEQHDGNIVKFVANQAADADEHQCPSAEASSAEATQDNFLLVAPDILIFSNSKDSLVSIHQRIQRQAVAEKDIATWQQYRSDKLASVAVFIPDEPVMMAPGITGHMIQAAMSEHAALRSIFLGASPSYAKAGVLFNAKVAASPQWANDSLATLRAGQSKLAQQSGAVSASFAELIQAVESSADEGVLDVSVALSRSTVNQIPNMISEAFTTMFTASSVDDAAELEEERIDENPWDYSINSALTRLPDYRDDNSSPGVLFRDGPFAIDLSNIEIDDSSGLLELEVTAKLQLPEFDQPFFGHGSGAVLAVRVDSVRGADGDDLLRDERCIEDLPRFAAANHLPAEGFNTSNNHASIGKTVRLDSSTSFNQVKSIHGSAYFKAPSVVKTLPLEPKPGAAIDTDGVRIHVNTVKRQSVTYQFSGDKDKLLKVRALNKEGQVLQSGSYFSAGQSATASFRGDIASLQVYIAQEYVDINVDFALDMSGLALSTASEQAKSVPKLPLPGEVSEQQWRLFRAIDLSAVDADAMGYNFDSSKPVIAEYAGQPFKILVQHDYNSSWQNQPTLHIVLPMMPELARNLSAIELQLVANASGADQRHNEFFDISPSSQWGSDQQAEYVADSQHNDIGLSLLRGVPNIELESGVQLSGLRGKLVIRLPRQVEKTAVPLPEFGAPQTVGANRIELLQINRGLVPQITYRVVGKPERLITLVQVTAANQRILPARTTFEDGQWQVKYHSRADIDHLELVTAVEQELIDLPFDLAPSY